MTKPTREQLQVLAELLECHNEPGYAEVPLSAAEVQRDAMELAALVHAGLLQVRDGGRRAPVLATVTPAGTLAVAEARR
jgi:hypothetical protein